jgi:drug/metabolite transporter (DMT)-like permease
MDYIIIFYFWYFLHLLYRFIYKAHKFQTTQTVHEGHEDSIVKNFFHPIMQSFAFFIMESLCLLVFYLTSSIKKTSYSPKIFIIPAAADLLASILQCSALAMISGSTFMMLKGANIVTTLVFARWLINFDIKSRHIVGCGLAVIGLAIVGLADIYYLSDKTAASTSDVFCTLL